jgi:hypothetical protein
MVFKLLGFDWIVRHSLTLYGISKKVLGARVTRRLLRATVGGQFLGGFSEEETRETARLLASRKMNSIWNFSTEQELSGGETDLEQKEARFDAVRDRYLKSITMSGKYNYLDSPVKLAAVKLTAIVDPHILLKLSQLLVTAQRQKGAGDLCELSEEGDRRQMEVVEWMGRFKVAESLSELEDASQSCGLPPWTATEREQVARLVSRLDDIGECAKREGVRVLVDAEESRLQPAIHHLAVHHMMPQFNRTKTYIYNTVQMYRKVWYYFGMPL